MKVASLKFGQPSKGNNVYAMRIYIPVKVGKHTFTKNPLNYHLNIRPHILSSLITSHLINNISKQQHHHPHQSSIIQGKRWQCVGNPMCLDDLGVFNEITGVY
jgi:hypothetical protein